MVIVINSMQRSGSNILTNILRSHDRIVYPIRETGELFPFMRRRDPASRALRALSRAFPTDGLRKHLRDHFIETAAQAIASHPVESTRVSDGSRYRPADFSNMIIVTKSLNRDVFFSPQIYQAFDWNYASLVLVKNGYTMIESFRRRGVSPQRFGRSYARYYGETRSCRGRNCQSSGCR